MTYKFRVDRAYAETIPVNAQYTADITITCPDTWSTCDALQLLGAQLVSQGWIASVQRVYAAPTDEG